MKKTIITLLCAIAFTAQAEDIILRGSLFYTSGGDMSTATYDTNGNSVVDNVDFVGGTPAADMATDAEVLAVSNVLATADSAQDTITAAHTNLLISAGAHGGETNIESVVDLQDLQGAVTDGQIPAAIARDSEVTSATSTLHTAISAEIDADISTHDGASASHPGFHKSDGTRPATGDWDMAGHSVTNISHLAINDGQSTVQGTNAAMVLEAADGSVYMPHSDGTNRVLRTSLVAAGTGGITVAPSTNNNVVTYTVSDDDAGGGGSFTLYGLKSVNVDWHQGEYGEGPTTSNAGVMTPYDYINASNSWATYSWYSADTTVLQSCYNVGFVHVPAWAASWGTTAMQYRIVSHSTSVADNYSDLNFMDGSGSYTVTNLVSGSADTWTAWTDVLLASLPGTMTNLTTLDRVILRQHFYAKSSNEIGRVEIKCNFAQ